MYRRIGKGVSAEETGERGGEDEERKQRHQRRDRQMRRHRPAVVVVEMAERIRQDTFDRDDVSHPRAPCRYYEAFCFSFGEVPPEAPARYGASRRPPDPWASTKRKPEGLGRFGSNPSVFASAGPPARPASKPSILSQTVTSRMLQNICTGLSSDCFSPANMGSVWSKGKNAMPAPGGVAAKDNSWLRFSTFSRSSRWSPW
jgi:hypothetical protein